MFVVLRYVLSHLSCSILLIASRFVLLIVSCSTFVLCVMSRSILLVVSRYYRCSFTCKTLFIVACVTICSVEYVTHWSFACVTLLCSFSHVSLWWLYHPAFCSVVYRNVSTVDQRPAERIIMAHAYSVVQENAQSPSTSRALCWRGLHWNRATGHNQQKPSVKDIKGQDLK